MPELIIRFWGVRGSLATPGPSTARYGGNTSCVEVLAGKEHIVFDMGSGLRELGNALSARPGLRATFFLSHYHWDHIQGLPFFGPAFTDPDATLTIYGATRMGKSVREILAGQMIHPYFPVSLGEMKAKLLFRGVESGGSIQVGPATVTAREIRHPGGALAYRVQTAGCSLVYATDFEHGTPADAALTEFARDTDLLILDATYTEAEYGEHRGWGHSTWMVATRIARASGAKRLILFHHDPSHTDEQIDTIVRQARTRFPATDAAREGRAYKLPVRRAASRRPARAAAKVSRASRKAR